MKATRNLATAANTVTMLLFMTGGYGGRHFNDSSGN
jgi:hypothetical protein